MIKGNLTLTEFSEVVSFACTRFVTTSPVTRATVLAGIVGCTAVLYCVQEKHLFFSMHTMYNV